MRNALFGATLAALVLAGFSYPVQAQDSAVEIDLTQTGEPISKYIYGQFIEHLGRCIYGGI